MSCKECWKKIFPLLVLTFSLFVINTFGQRNQIKPCNQADDGNREGIGISVGDTGDYLGVTSNEKPTIYAKGKKLLQIVSKPIAKYTDEARNNCIEGIVKLRITFFSNGKVGNFKDVNGLPFGLSENAIEAAKLIRFEPAMKRGKPITVTKTVSYNFTIY